MASRIPDTSMIDSTETMSASGPNNSIATGTELDVMICTMENTRPILSGSVVSCISTVCAVDKKGRHSSESLLYQGLDNIDSIEALLSNGNTVLWIKRSLSDEFFYRRTSDSKYSAISSDTYKKNICLILNEEPVNRFLDVYERVFDERVTFRSFSFLNFIEEKGLGDLSVVFTKAKDLKYQIRIKDIMSFFFNYDNVEQIYKKRVDLEQSEEEFSKLNKSYLEYHSSLSKMKKLFSELQIKHTGDIVKDAEAFKKFKSGFERNQKPSAPDLVFLTRASFSLAEEIKLYSYMQNQSKNMVDRKSRTARLLSILDAVVAENSKYKEYSTSISELIKTIDDEKVILALTDYQASIKQIKAEKDKIDKQIDEIRAQSTELEYDEAIKKIGLLEDCFSIVETNVDANRVVYLEQHIKDLKNELKQLRTSYNKNSINRFNADLTKRYLSESIHVKHVEEDRVEPGFAVEFEPFRSVLVTAHLEDNIKKYYWPGSMTRQTHLQILTYLCMFEYLKENFAGFIYMPLLVIDSANQPMGIEIFEQLYPSIIEYANQIGIQTIFLSKEKIDGIDPSDFIDISNGLNKFHKQSTT